MANGGTVYEPHIAKAIVTPTGKLVKRIKPVVRDHLPISSGDLDYIRQAMYGVTTENGGTAAGVFGGWPMSKVLVGGKTGTAELTGTNQNGSWFASFAGPAGGKPQYAAVIEVHKAAQGAEGAAPFVKAMWSRIYGLGGDKAIFTDGVPPTALPKVGAAAIRAHIAKHKAHLKAQRKELRQQQQNSGTTTTDSPSPPPSSPSSSADGVPPGLVAERRYGSPS
jgi:penicillin-binding protein 2